MNQDPALPAGSASPAPPEFGAEPPYPPPTPPQTVPVKTPKLTPIVSYALLALTVLVYLLQLASASVVGIDLPRAFGIKVNELIAAGQWWRLLAPMLLHGSILHLGFNMYALSVLGPGLERYYGHARFLALYLLAGFAGNVFSFLFTRSPSLGASTAVFGLLGAQGTFLYRNRRLFGGMARRALSNIVMIAGMNLVISLQPGIDKWGHLGGLLGGTLFAWLGGPLLGVEGDYPALELRDKRGLNEVFLAGVGVAALFIFLAAAIIFIRS